MPSIEDAYDKMLAALPATEADKLTDQIAMASNPEKLMLEQMSALNADCNHKHGVAAFLHACATGDTPMIAALLQHDEGVDEVDPQGLLLATMGRHEDAVAMLLAAGADATLAMTIEGSNALHVLASHDSYEPDEAGARLVARLVNDDDDSPMLFAHNSDGLTPLGEAVTKGNIAVVRALLDAGADVNAVCSISDQRTPIMLCFTANLTDELVPSASGKRSLEQQRDVQHAVIALLVDANADLGQVDVNGQNIFRSASKKSLEIHQFPLSCCTDERQT